MVFSSTIFLFGFLPFVLLAYYLTPRPLKNSFLLCASLYFYAWGEKQYTVVLVGSILGNYFAGVSLDSCRRKARQGAIGHDRRGVDALDEVAQARAENDPNARLEAAQPALENRRGSARQIPRHQRRVR